MAKKGQRALWGPLKKALILFSAPPSPPNYLSNPLPPDTITLEILFQHMSFVGQSSLLHAESFVKACKIFLVAVCVILVVACELLVAACGI